MKIDDFDYSLPKELIAQQPAAKRSQSRLLHLGKDVGDRSVSDLPDLLRPGDLLVFNDTQVVKARLFGAKPTGGKIEILVERVLSETEALVQLGVSKKPLAGSTISIHGEAAPVKVLGRSGEFFHLCLAETGNWLDLMARAGQLPLPPYIRHTPQAEDADRYQTVFARAPGAVAAPTAGLHFDQALLARLDAAGIQRATLTLHVGAGTFQPVRVENIESHQMHAERYSISEELAQRFAETRRRGGRIVAVGTTSVRALESAVQADGQLRTGDGETRIFITPGVAFRAVDLLMTNFHLPQSTLMMLVCAFGGHERVMAAYAHAVAQRYRFFSYGDAMLIEPLGGSTAALA